ncbi:MAG TPA: WecB/TagA/CpsF family glycosyltransferase [Gaiellales bacterium]|nr:WecB/TagA/CpsF family glycosyltransferase [Gaiellales bacterium]
MLTATRSTPVLGVDFFAGSYDDAVHAVIDRGLTGAGGYATLTSVHGLVLAQHDAVLRRALDEATTNFPDGVPVTWLQHSTGAPGAQRVCGIDLMPSVLEAGQAAGLRHYFLGSTPAVLAALRRQTAARYPEAQVVGTYSPPFAPFDAWHEEAMEGLRASCPHLVWVGLGAPKQELWMHRFAADYHPALALGVGAAFDIVASMRPRAPAWMRRHGLEWLYRLGLEPRRLTQRYARYNSEFAVRAAMQIAAVKARRHAPGGRP